MHMQLGDSFMCYRKIIASTIAGNIYVYQYKILIRLKDSKGYTTFLPQHNSVAKEIAGSKQAQIN